MKFLVIDAGGGHVGTAQRLAEGGDEVTYYSPTHHSYYERFVDYAPGVGVPGIKKVPDFGPYVDQADCIVFPDSGLGGLCSYLRSKDYHVYGAGKAEELEFDRALAVKMMQRYGIKAPPTYPVIGVSNCLAKIEQLLSPKRETNQIVAGKLYCKLDVWRGTLESFPVESRDQAEEMFKTALTGLGPYADHVPMILQSAVEGVETGFDMFFDGEQFLRPGMWGFENGADYVGYVSSDLKPFEGELDKFAKLLGSYGYIGAFSTECIFDGKDFYHIDLTTRTPMPLGLLYTIYADYNKLIYGLATGEADSSTLKDNQYLACMEVSSEEAGSKYLPIAGGKHTRFLRYMGNGEQLYSVPGSSIVGIVGSSAPSLADLQGAVETNAEEASIYFGSYNTRFIESTYEKFIQPLAEQGVMFGPRGNTISESGSPASQVLKRLRGGK